MLGNLGMYTFIYVEHFVDGNFEWNRIFINRPTKNVTIVVYTRYSPSG